jgi:hypothetical protein
MFTSMMRRLTLFGLVVGAVLFSPAPTDAAAHPLSASTIGSVAPMQEGPSAACPFCIPIAVRVVAGAVGAGVAAAIGWDLWQETKHHFWACIRAIRPAIDWSWRADVAICAHDIVSKHGG